MNQVVDFFKKLFDTSDWPPRWQCGTWSDFHGWLYIISDLMIWSAYFAIPVIILRYISRRRGIHFHKVYFLFAGFILACGSTHFIDAVIFWNPLYRVSAVLRAVTGIVSWITVFYLIKMLPQAFALKTPAELENEVEKRRMAERELQIKNQLLNEAQEIAKVGHWQWDIASNKLEWSESLFKLYGMKVESSALSYDDFLKHVHPDDRSFVEARMQQSIQQKKFQEYYHRIVKPTGEVRTMHSKGEVILNDKSEVAKTIGTSQDVTELKQAEHALLQKTEELEGTNLELQKFAYVASHDLQEPLRKIITFTSMLEKHYKSQLDERARMYMDKVVTSSVRMQKLIDDILYFSKFNSNENFFEPVDLGKIAKEVINDMELTIEAADAKISVGDLPEIEANETQIRQLFQNLVSNAIKFKRDGVEPNITITSKLIAEPDSSVQSLLKQQNKFVLPGSASGWKTEKFVQLVITDNGIGFDAAYADKIFEIFQRLHGKAEYEGTGIGLAIVKKIIENHHGKISATGTLGQGAEFTIVLPVSQGRFANG